VDTIHDINLVAINGNLLFRIVRSVQGLPFILQEVEMKINSIALCRVSSPDQVLSNSLNRQRGSVTKASELLNAPIIRTWSGDVSSRAGKNLSRKDLKEMMEFCRENKRVKYLIVDEVDRFMRSIDEFYFFEVTFKNLGVKVWYASQPELNTDDMNAKITKLLAILRAEMSNTERQGKSFGGLEDQVLKGYHPFPIHQGYMKSATPGLHIPDSKRFSLLQEAFLSIASGQLNKHEALANLTKKGYETPTGKILRIDKFEEILKNDFYAGFVSVKTWNEKFQKIKGLHVSMITPEQHKNILVYLSNKRAFIRKTHNPDFPMANLFSHKEDGLRFTGGIQNNGRGSYYPKYRCRSCNKQFNREDIHEKITKLLDTIEFNSDYKNTFIQTLEQVWREEEKSNLDYLKTLEKRKIELEGKKNKLVETLAQYPTLRDDIKLTIDKTKNDISIVETQIYKVSKIENDMVEFINFSLDFIKNKSKRWWELEFDDRSKCKQLIFSDEIYYNSTKKVCTSEISPILRFVSIKKEPEKCSDSLLVELRGVAPLSE